MSGVIFLFDVIAFVMLAYWSYWAGQRPGGDGDGVFGVKKELAPRDEPKGPPDPPWRRAATPRLNRSRRPVEVKPRDAWRARGRGFGPNR